MIGFKTLADLWRRAVNPWIEIREARTGEYE